MERKAMVVTAHRVLVTLIVWGIVAQFVLAGAGAFGATSFSLHKTLGTALAAASLAALALVAVGRAHLRLTALLAALLVLQAILGRLGSDQEPWLGAVHGLNALAVMAAAGILTRRAWEAARAA